MKVLINEKEKRLIKTIAHIQIKSLKEIIENDMERDIIIDCLQDNLDPNEVISFLKQRKKKYKRIYKHPELFLTLPDKELGMFKHILENYFDSPEYSEERRSIWRKMNLAEDFLFSLN